MKREGRKTYCMSVLWALRRLTIGSIGRYYGKYDVGGSDDEDRKEGSELSEGW